MSPEPSTMPGVWPLLGERTGHPGPYRSPQPAVCPALLSGSARLNAPPAHTAPGGLASSRLGPSLQGTRQSSGSGSRAQQPCQGQQVVLGRVTPCLGFLLRHPGT